MNKRKIFIASLILAAGAFAAEESKWDFSGSNVEGKLTVYESSSSASSAGKDEDLILKVSKKLDEKTTLSFKYDTDDSNPDYKIEAVVNRKFNEFVEAQLDLDLITGDKDGSGKGTRIEEDYDSDKVFIKYTPNNKLAVKFNPFNIGLTVGDVFETSNEQKTPGIQAEYKVSETTTVYAGIGTGKYDNGSSLKNITDKNGKKEETVLGIKAGMTYKKDNTYLKVALSTNTQDDTDIVASQASALKSAASVIASQKMGKLTFEGEAIVTQINKANTDKIDFALTDSETGVALFAKVKYSMGTLIPYAQIIYADEYAYFDDTDYSATLKGTSVSKHGGLTAIQAGSEYVLKGGLKVVPYVEMKTTENKVFKDKDGNSNAEDKYVAAAIKVKMSF